MTLPALTIIPAGAGSGKTYSIQQQLGEWVIKGRISPERIVAVTFTEAAAAELRERIRLKLLELGRLEDALKLDQAYISTIHGFGLRLLTEFAFDAGLSPRPRMLSEDEENILIRLALAQTDKADQVISNLARYGYRYDFNTDRSAEACFRDVLLNVVSRLRSIGWKETKTDYAKNTVEWIKQRYGKTGKGKSLTNRLYKAVNDLLTCYPENLALEFGTNNTALDALQDDYRNICKAQDFATLSTDWKLWQSLRSLRQSKKGSPLPDGYDSLADAVMDAANALPRHPGPLKEASMHIEALLSASQDVLVHYAESKRKAGLVDYTDMLALAHDVLTQCPDVLKTLRSRIDCLVVDEFQDTNPLQFSLLWQLKEAGVPTVIVGDLKQAIMGFQGADPRLFAELANQYRDNTAPLTRNWRSQPRLMKFINAVSAGLFGDEYVSLEPKGNNSDLDPVEIIAFHNKAKRAQHAVRAASVGLRLAKLLRDKKQQVIDRRTKQRRQLRGGDIAVLCPTHNMLAQYAEVFRSQGLRVRMQQSDWYSTREVQILRHALAYVANTADRHAALYLAVTELGSLSLQDALQQLMDKGEINEPILGLLNKLAANSSDRTVYALVADILSALNIFDVISSWPNAEQARANILRLLAEAGEFMQSNRDALASGCFYGSGVQSFLAWLDVKVEQRGNDYQPEPKVIDEEAIELVTWHGSKGREWPVVAVCGMDRKIRAGVPDLSLGYTSFDDLTNLLDSAHIEYSPGFAAPETNEKFLIELQAASETESRRLLYVALTRPRDKLILEWPAYLEGKAGQSYWSILADEVGLTLHKNTLQIGKADFDCVVIEGASELTENTSHKEKPDILPTYGRRAIVPGDAWEWLTPDSVTPSSLIDSNSTVSRANLETIQYGDGLSIVTDSRGAELGTFLHRCFAVLGTNPALETRLSAITGIELSKIDVEQIARCASNFEHWLNQYFSIKSVSREVPLLALDENNSVVSGTADLVVETDKGVWIIDHKSDRIEDPVSAFICYQSQLEAYANALLSSQKRILGIGINWIRNGCVVLNRRK